MSTFTITPKGDVVLCMTLAEARGLHTCADDGASGMLSCKLSEVSGWFDHQSQRDAAARALQTLAEAIEGAKP